MYGAAHPTLLARVVLLANHAVQGTEQCQVQTPKAKRTSQSSKMSGSGLSLNPTAVSADEPTLHLSSKSVPDQFPVWVDSAAHTLPSHGLCRISLACCLRSLPRVQRSLGSAVLPRWALRLLPCEWVTLQTAVDRGLKRGKEPIAILFCFYVR